MEHNPRAVFERLFGDSGSTERAARETRMQQHKSILDSVTDKLTTLKQQLGPQDQTRVDEYSDAVRDVERRIQRAEEQAHTNLDVPAAPVGVPESFEEHVGLLYELLALAYEADLTRVFTFMKARELSQRTYPNIGVTLPHHQISHHANNPERIANHATLNTYHVQLFARFLDRLSRTSDGDGSLLDHSLFLYGSGMGNGNVHAAYPLPTVAVGGKALLTGNHHVIAAERTPNANLLLTIATKFGANLDTFGVSTGRVEF
jgi:hypothetical protein